MNFSNECTWMHMNFSNECKWMHMNFSNAENLGESSRNWVTIESHVAYCACWVPGSAREWSWVVTRPRCSVGRGRNHLARRTHVAHILEQLVLSDLPLEPKHTLHLMQRSAGPVSPLVKSEFLCIYSGIVSKDSICFHNSLCAMLYSKHASRAKVEHIIQWHFVW